MLVLCDSQSSAALLFSEFPCRPDHSFLDNLLDSSKNNSKKNTLPTDGPLMPYRPMSFKPY